MATLRIRAYNVRFGDAILIKVPDHDPVTDKTTTRHILIDVGNVLGGEGGQDAVFQPVIADILDQLHGQPLDLYVMTHEHLDHVQGLPWAAKNLFAAGELKAKLDTQYAWLTASAAPDYYDTHEDARKQLADVRAMYEAVASYFAAAGTPLAEGYRTLLLNNNPAHTGDCVDYLRNLASRTSYVHRGMPLDGTHPFHETEFEIWAPEEDTSDYYGTFRPMALGLQPGERGAAPTLADPVPPSGVDGGAFYQLIEQRRSGLADNLLEIDKAANNTSVVFSLKWRGWTLLFPGDAELRSWQTMQREGVLRPVHFLKVAHHGSHNGTPDGDILEAILPDHPPDHRWRRAIISSYPHTYSGIPHGPTNDKLRQRVHLRTTQDDPEKLYVEIRLRG